MKHEFEQTIIEGDVTVEDSGCAVIVHIDHDLPGRHLFVKLQSWDDMPNPQHPELKDIVGKKVKITVEIED